MTYLNSEELVTLVVSVYNVEEWLPACLDSITRQTYKNLEVLLIDDGSTDGSGALCDAFVAKDPRARVIHQENQGCWAVRNRGQAESKGEYLVFVDADDYFHKDFVRLLHEAINMDGKSWPMAMCNYERVSGIYGDVDSDLKPIFALANRDRLIDAFFSPVPEENTAAQVNWNKLYRKRILEIPFQRRYMRCQDGDSNLRAYLSGIDQAVILENVMYFWRARPGELTISPDDRAIRNVCRSHIFYTILREMPESMKIYRHYLLMALYRRFLFWKETVRGTVHQEEAFRQIRKFERDTIVAFLLHGGCSFNKRVRILMRLHCPKLKKYYYQFKRLF